MEAHTISPQKDGARTYITRAELERCVDSCSVTLTNERNGRATLHPRSDSDRREWTGGLGLPRAVTRGRRTEKLDEAAPRQRPSAVITVSPTFDPEYCCCPVINRPSRTTKALNSPPWT